MRLTDKNIDTGKLVIEEEDGIRYLYIDGSLESAMHTQEGKKDELVFGYLQCLKYPMSFLPGDKDVFLIGSGGFCYPYTFLSREQGTITAAEMSKDIIEYARQYFLLKDIEENERFHLVQGDGFSWLENCGKQFDFIVNDAYIGRHSVGVDIHNTEMIQRHLSEKGIYAINFVASLEGEALREEMEILNSCFQYSTLMIVSDDVEADEEQNLLLLASNTYYGW